MVVAWYFVESFVMVMFVGIYNKRNSELPLGYSICVISIIQLECFPLATFIPKFIMLWYIYQFFYFSYPVDGRLCYAKQTIILIL